MSFRDDVIDQPLDPHNADSVARAVARARKKTTAGNVPKCPKLSTTQLEAIELLLQGESRTYIARELDINRRTLGRWLELDLFQIEHRRAANRLMGVGANHLKTLSRLAARTLQAAMETKSVNLTQVRAALGVLSETRLATIAEQNADILERLERLEKGEGNE